MKCMDMENKNQAVIISEYVEQVVNDVTQIKNLGYSLRKHIDEEKNRRIDGIYAKTVEDMKLLKADGEERVHILDEIQKKLLMGDDNIDDLIDKLENYTK